MHGSKGKYTEKQKRQAEEIAKSYRAKRVPAREAKRRAWATVNKETGGGQKSGSGLGKSKNELKARRSSVAKSAASTRKGHPLKRSTRTTTRKRATTASRGKTAKKSTAKKSSARRSTASAKKGTTRRSATAKKTKGRSTSSRKTSSQKRK